MPVVRALSTRTLKQHLQAQHAPRQRKAECAKSADAGAFGGGEDAAVDAAHDDDEQRGDGPDFLECEQSLGPRRALGVRAGRRVAPAHVLHREAEQPDGEQSRQHTGGEEFADARLGHDAVDHHDRRRRDQDTERAARGDRADGELIRIPVVAHRRVCDFRHRRRGGDRRAANRAETGARHHGGHRQAAAQMPDEGVRGAVQLLRHAGARDEVAHQDEQRNDRERVLEPRLVDDGRCRGHRRPEALHPPQSEKTHQPHRERDRHANEGEQHHECETAQRFCHGGPAR